MFIRTRTRDFSRSFRNSQQRRLQVPLADHAAVLLESREYSVDLSWPLGGNCEVAREIVTFGAHVSQPDLNPWMPRVSR
jgi:hypothetical protein